MFLPAGQPSNATMGTWEVVSLLAWLLDSGVPACRLYASPEFQRWVLKRPHRWSRWHSAGLLGVVALLATLYNAQRPDAQLPSISGPADTAGTRGSPAHLGLEKAATMQQAPRQVHSESQPVRAQQGDRGGTMSPVAGTRPEVARSGSWHASQAGTGPSANAQQASRGGAASLGAETAPEVAARSPASQAGAEASSTANVNGSRAPCLQQLLRGAGATLLSIAAAAAGALCWQPWLQAGLALAAAVTCGAALRRLLISAGQAHGRHVTFAGPGSRGSLKPAGRHTIHLEASSTSPSEGSTAQPGQAGSPVPWLEAELATVGAGRGQHLQVGICRPGRSLGDGSQQASACVKLAGGGGGTGGRGGGLVHAGRAPPKSRGT